MKELKDIKQILSRRSFLIDTGVGLGSCLIPRDYFRRLWRWYEFDCNEEILLPDRTLQSPKSTLFFYDDYRITLGKHAECLEDVNIPLWRDYLEGQGFNTKSEIIKEWLIEAEGYEPVEAKKYYRRIQLDKQLDGPQLAKFMEVDYPLCYSPEAQAFSYLESLPLKNSAASKGDDWLGELKFSECGFIASNFTAVFADSHFTLSALQHRLLELGEDVRIEYGGRI